MLIYLPTGRKELKDSLVEASSEYFATLFYIDVKIVEHYNS